jgi:hypothetical protein
MELENQNFVGSSLDEKDNHIFDCHDKIRELKSDILTLVGRLYSENDDTFAPETHAVMKRWKPAFAKLYLNAASKQAVKADAKTECAHEVAIRKVLMCKKCGEVLRTA